jgi:hypothetical protein
MRARIAQNPPVPGPLASKIVHSVAAERTSEDGRTLLNLGFG